MNPFLLLLNALPIVIGAILIKYDIVQMNNNSHFMIVWVLILSYYFMVSKYEKPTNDNNVKNRCNGFSYTSNATDILEHRNNIISKTP
jgi:hypothetical protein